MRSWNHFSVGKILLGVFLILIGILWLLDMLGYITFNICILGPILLILAGIGILVSRDVWW
jgi:membrane protein required for beta-lactamase induction